MTSGFSSRVALSGLLLAGSLFVGSVAARAATTGGGTLTVSLPGPLRGCGYYDHNTSPSLRALLDLIRPSAFTPSVGDIPVGGNGPISAASVTSLSPQTVQYTISPGFEWSNGAPFTATDLLAWFNKVRTVSSTQADGYRDISSFTVNPAQTVATAVFTKPYADWSTLFRDIDFRGTPLGCTMASLVNRPSLGPYDLISVSPTSATLALDPRWTGQQPAYTYVIVRTDMPVGLFPNHAAVGYLTSATPSYLLHISNRPYVSGHISPSDQIVNVGYSSRAPSVASLVVREFLSLALDRQSMINQVFGPVTYTPALADSYIYAQSSAYHGEASGYTPYTQSALVPLETVPTSVNQDCVACAIPTLTNAGYTRRRGVWISPKGSPLVIRVAVGPSSVDRATAAVALAQWRHAGVVVRVVAAASDQTVTADLARGVASVGVYTMPVGLVPGQVARGWTGVNGGDDFDLGWRSAAIDALYTQAQATYNPVDATQDYLQIDAIVATNWWARPLYTEPLVTLSSSDVGGVVPTSSIAAFVNEIPNWISVTPSTSTP